MNIFTTTLFAISIATATVPAQGATASQDPGEQKPTESVRTSSPELDAATARLIEKLETATEDLTALRARIAEERLPLAEQLSELESRFTQAKTDLQEAQSAKDSRSNDLNTLTEDVDARRKQITFLTGQLDQFADEFDAGLLLHELQRYRPAFMEARAAAEDSTATPTEVFTAQLALIDQAMSRLESAMGGERYAGRATDERGFEKDGTFVTVGPVAYFSSTDGSAVGLVRNLSGTLQPTVSTFTDPLRTEAALEVLREGSGTLPVDPTLGAAARIEATEQTWLEHIQAGGPVMYPIFGMAGIALLIALYKWARLQFVPRPSRKLVDRLLDQVRDGENEAAERTAREMDGPMGDMLLVGTQALGYPKDLIEEVMYESMLTSKRKLNSLLPFIGVCAAAAPLMGLLGTVTGIIDTFRLITEFGSGDAKSLSGGISEALITTKFGLIVAIPSLLIHAYLSRKARGIVSDMESAAISLVNRVTTIESQRPRVGFRDPAMRPSQELDSDAVREQVEEIVREMLAPITSAGGAQPDPS